MAFAQSSNAGCFRFISTDFRNVVIMWKDFKILRTFEVPAPMAIAITADNSEFIVHSERSLRIYSLKSLDLLKTIEYERNILAISDYA